MSVRLAYCRRDAPPPLHAAGLSRQPGGYTSSSKEVTTILRQRSRPYLFSNALPPPVVAAASSALDKLMASTRLRDHLQANTQRFRSAMAAAGFKIKGVDHPIVPIMLGDARLASEFAEDMLKRDIYVIGFSYPVVPVGTYERWGRRGGERRAARTCARPLLTTIPHRSDRGAS